MSRTLAMRSRDFAEFIIRPRVFTPLLVFFAMMIAAWGVDRGLPTSDEGVVLALAGKILRGGVFYRDLDAYQFPGSMYLLAAWMWAFGETVNSARWLAAVVFSGIVLGLYLVALQLVDRGRAAVFGLGLLSFKFLAYPAFTAFMYSDFALCCGIFAIALFLRHSYDGGSIRLVASGVLVACATASKQNLGIYLAGTAIFILAFSPKLLGWPDSAVRRRVSEVGAFVLGLFIAAAPMLGYFASKGLLLRLFISGVKRPFVAYLPTSGISFFEPLAWWNFGDLRGNEGFPFFIGPLWTMLMNARMPFESLYTVYWAAGELFTRVAYTAFPLAFLVVLWRWFEALRSGDFDTRSRRLFVFSALAFAVTLSAFPRADLFHVLSIYPVVFLLLFALQRPDAGREDGCEAAMRCPWLSACAVGILLVVCLLLSLAHRGSMTHRMQLARADLYVEPSKAWVEPVLDFVEERLGSNGRLFIFGHEAHLYFLSGRYYSWPFAQLYPGQVGAQRGMPLVHALQARTPDLILRGIQRWPGVPDLADYGASPTYFIVRNYWAYEDFFEDHPPPVGEAPPIWAMSVLLPRGL